MFRFLDPKHPLYTAEGAAKWGPWVEQAYIDMDKIVGEAMAKRPDAALMVLSDHGFASFRRGMNYNTWLVQNGFMTLTGQDAKRKNLEDLFEQGQFPVNVDSSKTKAYALGLGQIYINEAGREGKGIVKPGEDYKTVAAQIKSRARGLHRPRDRRAPGGPRLHPRRGLRRRLRPGADPRPHPVEQRGVPRRLAGQPGRHRQGDRRAQHRDLERRPLARSIPSW